MHRSREDNWDLIRHERFAHLSEDEHSKLGYTGYEVGLVCRLKDNVREIECVGIKNGESVVPLTEPVGV